MKFNDIVIIQEHWLYCFEKQFLETIAHENNWSSAIMCTDELDPISPFLKCPRGKGGVAILWNNKISNEITTLPDCSRRMMAIRVANELCIINVYMPARGLSDSDLEFESCLDKIAEMIIKYGGDLDIIFGGDINASLHRQKKEHKKGPSLSQI